MVKLMSREFIFLAVASQSSISIGFSPSVRSTILRVHVFLDVRYWCCVSIPTMRASIAIDQIHENIRTTVNNQNEP